MRALGGHRQPEAPVRKLRPRARRLPRLRAAATEPVVSMLYMTRMPPAAYYASSSCTLPAFTASSLTVHDLKLPHVRDMCRNPQ